MLTRCSQEVLARGAHKRCSQEVLTRGAHKRCSQGAHKRCSQEVLTRGAHKGCSQEVLTRGAHNGCSQEVLTRCSQEVLTMGAHKRCSQGAHNRCSQEVLTRGAHKRCSQGRKLATFWRKVARTLNKHETNLAEAWNNLAQTCAALSQGKASNSRHNPVERIAILNFGSDLGARFDSKLQHSAVSGPNTAQFSANSRPEIWREELDESAI